MDWNFSNSAMPAAVMDAPETEEERRRKLIASSGGGAMPAVNSPETEEGRPVLKHRSAPPVETPGVDLGDPIANKSVMPAAMSAAPAEMRANALEPARTPPGFFAGAEEHPHGSAGAEMPPAFYAGNSEQPHKPIAQANTMPAVGPATKAYEELQAQGRPELHGWKKALDVASQLSPIGRTIEHNISGSPGHYDAELSRAAMAAAREQGIETHAATQQREAGQERRANAPQHVGQFTSDEGHETEVSRDPNTGGFATQDVGEVKDAKENAADKKIDEYVNDQQQRVLTFQRRDGSTYDKVGGKTFEKPVADANKLAGEIEAQVGPKPTTAQYGGKTYPNVEAAQRAWGSAAEAIKNREAGAGREVLNQGKAVNVLRKMPDGTTQLVGIHPDELKPGDVLAGAGSGMQTMSKEAQFQEIHSGIDNLRTAIAKLDRPFSPEQIGKLTLAMKHTNDPTVFRTELETLLGTQQLTGPQEDLVIWLGHLNERALSIRNIAGMGQGSDSMRAAIQGILPSVKSGSTQMMNKQLAAFENQVNKLEKGVPKMPGGGGGGAENPLGLTPPGTH